MLFRSFALTLSSEAGFARVVAWGSTLAAKLLVLALVWAFAQHFFSGLRHLALDVHWGLQLKSARRSSLVVLLATGGVVLLAAWGLFG